MRAIGTLAICVIVLGSACTDSQGGVPGQTASSQPTSSSGAGGATGSSTSGTAASGGTVASGGSGGAGGAEGAEPCPADMVLAGDSCVDRFEAPNQEGAEPLAMQTAFDGQAWCEARGKRLCRDVEWIRACEGDSGLTYPYGNDWVEHRCNDDKTWIPVDWTALASWPSAAAQQEATKLYQADPSGSRDQCLSLDGAFDLTGNVAEWVVRTIPNSTNHDHVMKGCYWSGCYGGTKPNCTFVNPAHPGGFRSYEAGFRCCRDPSPAR